MRYDEKKLVAKREAVRKALAAYEGEIELALDVEPRGSGASANDYDHLQASFTQVQSARRVLWMEG